MAHENEESFEHVKKLPGVSLISRLKGLSENLNHKWEKALKRFLMS
jgi:hypothetical protein